MELTITEDAAQWYIDELDIDDDSYLRFYVRYGGVGGLVPGFSIGVNLNSPQHIHTSTVVKGITFYIEESDAWYFEGKNLHISIDERSLEPKFSYN